MNAWFAGGLAALLCLPLPASAGGDVAAAARSPGAVDTSRIVSVGSAITEILYALGAEVRVVAVDTTSVFPPRAQEKASVGYMRTLSAEGVLSVNPSVIIAVEGSGPAEAIAVLEAASVPFILIPEATDADGVLRKIRAVADVIGESEKGDLLAAAVAEDIAALASFMERIDRRRKALFVLSMGAGSPMVGGRDTAADAIFTLAGVDNALAGMSGYKPASEEAALAAAPDAVVVMSERSHDLGAKEVFAVPAFAGTPAAKAGRLISLPGTYLLGFGPRVAHAARDLAASVYPELDLPALPDRRWVVGRP